MACMFRVSVVECSPRMCHTLATAMRFSSFFYMDLDNKISATPIIFGVFRAPTLVYVDRCFLTIITVRWEVVNLILFLFCWSPLYLMIACCAQTARIVTQWAQMRRTNTLAHRHVQKHSHSANELNMVRGTLFGMGIVAKSLFIRFHWISLLSIIIFLMFAAPRKGQKYIYSYLHHSLMCNVPSTFYFYYYFGCFFLVCASQICFLKWKLNVIFCWRRLFYFLNFLISFRRRDPEL